MAKEQSNESGNKKKGGCFKWIVVILLVIIAFSACVAAISGGGSEDGDSSTDDSGASEESTEETAEEDSAASNEETAEESNSPDASIGEQLDVGALSYLVNDVYTTNEVGSSMFPETANETFVVINLSVTNNGNEAVTVDSTYFSLLINGNTLDASSSASTSANQNENGEITNSFFLENLNPGSTLEGNIVFDISESLANNPDKVLQAQEGIFGSKTGTIILQ